ncbi:MAG: hypothetical protein K8R68_04595 [Bacteroidales bacterium]|nr:hypothetical protein [Bacteroidales bacterium]
MFFRILIVFSTIFIYSQLPAQVNSTNQTEKDYQKFKETLQEEVSEMAMDSTKSSGIVLHPASLPKWLFELPASNQNIMYSVGISDPGMTKEEALLLAELRAKTIISLLIYPKVSSLIDNFSNENSNQQADEFVTKYENLFNVLSSMASSKNNFNTVRQYFTSFNEAVVLLEFINVQKFEGVVDSIKLEVDAYQVERQKYNSFEMEEKIEINGSLKSNGDSISFNDYSYITQSLNNLFEIKSLYNSKNIKFPQLYFRYQGQEDKQVGEFESSGSKKLNYGLWKAYIESLLQNIFILSQPFSGEIQQVGDSYSSKTQSLSREISKANPSFKINSININNNQLSVDVEYLNKTK